MQKRWRILALTACVAVTVLGAASCSKSGKSAYEIACENGFTGTQSEWLSSLKGANGKDGESANAYQTYQALLQMGDYSGDYQSFLKEYFSVSVQEDNAVATIAENMTSIVAVQCGFDVPLYGQTATSASWGSGVIFDLDRKNGDATIVTNYHVVYHADSLSATGIAKEIYVYLYGGVTSQSSLGGGDSIRATYVGGAMEYDVAILRVTGSDKLKSAAVSAAKTGSSGKAIVGEKTFVMGNPAGEGLSVTSGILSKDSEIITISMEIKNGTNYNATRKIDYRVMRTDAPINGGNSGGGLFNARGELIGIVNAKTVSGNIDNMGYALPIDNVAAVVKNVLDSGGRLRVADLGLTLKTQSASGYLDADGSLKIEEKVVVSGVALGSLSSGKLQIGDEILEIAVNGKNAKIRRAFEVEDLAIGLRKGDLVQIKYRRTGLFGAEEKTVILEIGANDFIEVA